MFLAATVQRPSVIAFSSLIILPVSQVNCFGRKTSKTTTRKLQSLGIIVSGQTEMACETRFVGVRRIPLARCQSMM